MLWLEKKKDLLLIDYDHKIAREQDIVASSLLMVTEQMEFIYHQDG